MESDSHWLLLVKDSNTTGIQRKNTYNRNISIIVIPIIYGAVVNAHHLVLVHINPSNLLIV